MTTGRAGKLWPNTPVAQTARSSATSRIIDLPRLFLREGVGAAAARHELAILVVDVRFATGEASAAAHDASLHGEVALERGLVVIHAQVHRGRRTAEVCGERIVRHDVDERGENAAVRIAARRIHDPFVAPRGLHGDAGLARLEHLEAEPLVELGHREACLQFILGHHLDMVGAFADNFQLMDANLGDLPRAAEPSKPAIIDCRDWPNPATLSYAALDEAAAAIARGLLARGDRVAIVSANRSEFVAAYLGTM